MRLDDPSSPEQSEAYPFNPLQSNQALQSSVDAFPISGQPVLDTTLKDMLLSLQTSLMSDLSSLINKFSSDIIKLGNRVSYIEDKMEECTTTVNDLVDAYDKVIDEQSWIKAKLADLEPQTALNRNNAKIRGIPKSIPPAELPKYANDLMHAILSNIQLYPDLFSYTLQQHR